MTQQKSREASIGGYTHPIPDSDIVMPHEVSRENQQPLPAGASLDGLVARIGTIDQKGAAKLVRQAGIARRRARSTSSQ